MTSAHDKECGKEYSISTIEQAEAIQKTTPHNVLIKVESLIDENNLCGRCACMIGAANSLFIKTINGDIYTDIAGAKVIIQEAHQLPQVKH